MFVQSFYQNKLFNVNLEIKIFMYLYGIYFNLKLYIYINPNN